MVFSSITFLFYFLPISLAMYFIVPPKGKNLVLLLASLFFYAWGEPIYIVLMLFSILLNYAFGFLIYNARSRAVAAGKSSAKFILGAAVAINLLLLGFFKYANFLIENLNEFFDMGIEPINLPLPIGISFYTFQAMSYLIDLYRGEVKLQRNLINFGTYVSMFPQLIAGPIVKLRDVEEYLNPLLRKHCKEDFAYGVRRFIIGLGKKVILANGAGMIWTNISSGDFADISVCTAWIGIIAFTFQIYFDFSGYSDMAIGLGRIFGFKFQENFNYPYMAKSVTEFWRRWHISLSTWFKEYVYIPLGGNRKGLRRQFLNIFLVWFLTGFWHGAAWNFMLWGIYFAVWLVLEKLFLKRLIEKMPPAVRHIYLMLIVVVSWGIFSLESSDAIAGYFKIMFGLGGAELIDERAKYLLLSYGFFFIILTLGSTEIPKRAGARIINAAGRESAQSVFAESAFFIALFVLSIAFTVASTYNPFLYFRF